MDKPFKTLASRRSFLKGVAGVAALPGLGFALDRFGIARALAQGNKTLVIAMQEGALRTLDPANANEVEWMIIGKALYDQLVTFNGTQLDKVLPRVASKWNISDDGLVYTFDLSGDVKFSDGTPVTADDVVFSLRRQKNLKGPGSFFLDGVNDIAAASPSQVKLTLAAPNTDLLPILTTPSLDITKAADIKANGGTDAKDAASTDTARAWLDTHSVGSGPFVIDSWTRGAQLVLKRNPNYWGPAAPFDTVIFRFVKDPTTQRNLLLRGDAHIAVNLTPDLAAAMASGSDPNLAVVAVPSLGLGYLNFNGALNPILADPQTWSAIKFAIDYDGLASIYQGGGQFTGSCVPPGVANALPASERQKQDIAAAKAALAASGHPKGFDFKLTYASDQMMQNVPAPDVAQKIRDDLQKVGINANLDPIPLSQELTDYRAGKLEADLHFWGVDYPGWTDYLPTFAPGGAVGLKRQAWAPGSSPEAGQIADLTGRALATRDAGEQTKLVLDAQRLMNQHGPYAWLFETNTQLGYRTDVIKTLPTNPIWFVDIGSIDPA